MGHLGTGLLFLVLSCLSYSPSIATQVSHDGRALTIDGQRRLIISGSIHYPRSTAEMWPDLIQKAKDGGLNAIETYVFWNIHEPRRREYNFQGNRDLIRFIKTVHQAGLYFILRIGPYACAEWNYGGLPVWLHQMEGIQLRTDNQIFKDEMQSFTAHIVNMVKEENLLAHQGGPIILTQIENEFGNVMGPYGAAGKKYVEWCAKMADSLNVGVPWIMCQQADAPQPMINTCNGFYCHNFKPNNANSPKMWTENWTGWFKAWGGRDPHRAAEDVSNAVALFFKNGGTLQNYYMYHGGTNFGRTSGGPYITTSYDYDAPLDEYGNLRQPKWGHLKALHLVLLSMENALVYGDVTTTDYGHGATATMYKPANGTAGCFLANQNGTTDVLITFQGLQYLVPAWSVSILPDCKNNVYNTAKIQAQTSIMVKKPNAAENEPAQLIWQWRAEKIKDTLKGQHGSFTSTQLLEQKMATGDTSDYLWYMTSVHMSKSDPIYSKHMTLRVNTTGHVLHAFFNGKHVGSQFGKNGNYRFVLEAPVTVKPKKNDITLLSATVGLANYGAFFDLVPAGIVGGPIELVGNGNVSKDLSASQWSYKIGLNGYAQEVYSENPKHDPKWTTEALPLNRRMTWYKTTFKPPLGEEPVVVDLLGMGKGEAWVNGQSIGRFWPTFKAPSDGCGNCDYRGTYDPKRCTTGCGEPTQRWYHVPRSFLRSSDNTLILFEEMGGNPTQVNFQTVTVGTVCGTITERNTVELSCQGDRTISQIQFASYGDPQGKCGSFKKGICESSDAFSAIQKACVGKTSCLISADDTTLGWTTCRGVENRLAVQAVCS
ncbi:beta-galactosidase 15-like [Magnolia sinica]|uniref:beta-galactosidase 15-like n=1 Tax=Magnolia sinica TaxID=86752 RepID=UPI0026580BAD|nr:beta-galactosidase 15-like [Magnolia sinica]